jgi:hypothetical protein
VHVTSKPLGGRRERADNLSGPWATMTWLRVHKRICGENGGQRRRDGRRQVRGSIPWGCRSRSGAGRHQGNHPHSRLAPSRPPPRQAPGHRSLGLQASLVVSQHAQFSDFRHLIGRSDQHMTLARRPPRQRLRWPPSQWPRRRLSQRLRWPPRHRRLQRRPRRVSSGPRSSTMRRLLIRALPHGLPSPANKPAGNHPAGNSPAAPLWTSLPSGPNDMILTRNHLRRVNRGPHGKIRLCRPAGPPRHPGRFQPTEWSMSTRASRSAVQCSATAPREDPSRPPRGLSSRCGRTPTRRPGMSRRPGP